MTALPDASGGGQGADGGSAPGAVPTTGPDAPQPAIATERATAINGWPRRALEDDMLL